MKTIIKICLLLFISINQVFGNNGNEAFDKANEFYSKGEYTQAIDQYKQLITNGYYSAELYFNLGNAYYKNNNIPFAIINYERAKLYAPGDDAIQFNLQLANTFKIDQIEEIPPFFLSVWYNAFANIFPFDIWAIISVVTFGLFTFLLLVYLFSKKTNLKKTALLVSVFSFFISITSLTMAQKNYKLVTDRNHAIIVTESVTVKSSPDESGTNLFVLHQGTKVEVGEKIANWYEIKIADGNTGWIPESDLVKI